MSETKLPRWQARNEHDHEHMHQWMVEKMREVRANGEDILGIPLTVWLKSDAPALLAAWHGNMQPLRAKYRHLAAFLHPPKRGRGEYLRKNPGDALLQAVEDVKLIEQIWEKYYPGKTRHPCNGPTAVEIAARRCGFSAQREKEQEGKKDQEGIDSIDWRVNKPSGPHKNPRRAKRG